MARFFHHIFPEWWRKNCRLLLAVFWLVGLFFGVLVFFHAGNSIASLMRMAAYSPVSIVQLLCVLILPFLVSAFAVMIYKPWAVLAISFVKASVFAFVTLSAIFAFGSAGWLLRLLLMFSELLSLPLLYWFWMHHISGELRPAPATLGLLAALVLLIVSFDFCYISPFLAGLLDYWKG